MNTIRAIGAGLGIIVGLTVSGCASPRSQSLPRSSNAAAADPAQHDSQLLIHYALGHSKHRIISRAQDNQVFVRSYLNNDLVKEADAEVSRYVNVFQESEQFVSHYGQAAPRTTCDDAFRIELRVGATRRFAEGCRTDANAHALSRIIRNAELLLYSKN